VNLDVGDGPLAVVRGDYNGDSKPDLTLTNSGNEDTSTLNTLSVLINATTKEAIGVGGSDSETASSVPSRTEATADRTRSSSPPGRVASLPPRRVSNRAGTSASQSRRRALSLVEELVEGELRGRC
jgi:hypothetical protein